MSGPLNGSTSEASLWEVLLWVFLWGVGVGLSSFVHIIEIFNWQSCYPANTAEDILVIWYIDVYTHRKAWMVFILPGWMIGTLSCGSAHLASGCSYLLCVFFSTLTQTPSKIVCTCVEQASSPDKVIDWELIVSYTSHVCMLLQPYAVFGLQTSRPWGVGSRNCQYLSKRLNEDYL